MHPYRRRLVFRHGADLLLSNVRIRQLERGFWSSSAAAGSGDVEVEVVEMEFGVGVGLCINLEKYGINLCRSRDHFVAIFVAVASKLTPLAPLPRGGSLPVPGLSDNYINPCESKWVKMDGEKSAQNRPQNRPKNRR